jgi:hypothetical protein
MMSERSARYHVSNKLGTRLRPIAADVAVIVCACLTERYAVKFLASAYGDHLLFSSV